MKADALAVGVGLLLLAAFLIRFRGPIADWQIERRVYALRNASLMNAEYVQREVKAVRRRGSQQLSRLLVVLSAIFFAALGVLAVTKGLDVF